MAEPAQQKDERSADLGPRMTFGEHLEELRRHVVRSLLVLGLLVVACFIVQDQLAELVMQPFHDAREWHAERGREIGKLTFIDPTEGIFFHLRIAFYGALIVGLPFFVYEMWRFIGAGLYPQERGAVMRVLPVSFGLLAIGVLFAYLVVLPIALRFLLGYGNPEYIKPEIRLDTYLSFFTMLCLLLGAVFQLPLVQVVLARFGIASAKFQSQKRRAFILGSLIAAAVVTPTGDAVTLMLVAVPMFVLYEIGIRVARRAERGRVQGSA